MLCFYRPTAVQKLITFDPFITGSSSSKDSHWKEAITKSREELQDGYCWQLPHFLIFVQGRCTAPTRTFTACMSVLVRRFVFFCLSMLTWECPFKVQTCALVRPLVARLSFSNGSHLLRRLYLSHFERLCALTTADSCRLFLLLHWFRK